MSEIERDWAAWPKIWSVQSAHSNAAFFNKETAERFVADRTEPNKFVIIEYVPDEQLAALRAEHERQVAALKEALKRFVENRHIIMPAIAGHDSFKRYFDAARTLLEADRKLRGEE